MAANVARYMETYFTDLVKGIDRDFKIQGKTPGRVVGVDNIKETIAKYMPVFETQVTKFTDWMMEGEIDSTDWGRYVGKEIKNLYLTVAAISKGHAGKLTPEDLKTIEKQLTTQYGYLNRFVLTLRHLDMDQYRKEYIINRILLYRGGTAEVMDRLRDRSLDKPELPFYPRDGDTLCMIHCQCYWDWVNVDPVMGDWDVYWVLNHDYENCETCRKRALACSPLQIRGAEIITELDLNDLII